MGVAGGRYGVVTLALATAALNLVYAIGVLRTFAEFGQDANIASVSVSAISALSGMVLILVWVALDPVSRRGGLLLMVVPLLVGNALHNVNLHTSGDATPGDLWQNLLFGLTYAGAHVYVYWLAGLGSDRAGDGRA